MIWLIFSQIHYDKVLLITKVCYNISTFFPVPLQFIISEFQVVSYSFLAAVHPDDDETVAMIKELLETRIRFHYIVLMENIQVLLFIAVVVVFMLFFVLSFIYLLVF